MSSSSAAHVGKVRLAAVAAALAASTLTAATGSALAAHRMSDGGGSHRLIVTFHAHASASDRQAALAAAGVTAVRRIDRLNMVVVRGSRAAAAALSRDDAVAYSELDRTVHAAATPNDPLFVPNANPCSSSYGCWPYANLGLPQAWTATPGSTTTVAVVDSGVNASHPDLAQVVLPGYNFVAGNTNVSDENGHGTMVSGVIAARQNNGIGIPGVCSACVILPVKVLSANGSGTTSTVAQGIQWAADHGARVINLSLAGTIADPALKSAITYANSEGALVVVAAGNSGSADPGAGSSGGYPAAFTSALSTGLISVAGVDASNALYSYSNHGSWVTVAAPGAATVPTSSGGYAVAFGTSIAAPFVSGVAGLALSVSPTLSVSALQSALTSTVTKVPGLDDATGGVVNAAAVVRSLAGSPAPAAPAPTPPTAPAASSAPAITPASVTAPVVTGSPVVGSLLSASAGGWGNAPMTYVYQWQSSADGLAWQGIMGAVRAQYTVGAADLGRVLRVTVTATNQPARAPRARLRRPRYARSHRLAHFAVLSGSSRVGGRSTASLGTWKGTAPAHVLYPVAGLEARVGRGRRSRQPAAHQVPAAAKRLDVRVRVRPRNAAGSASTASASVKIVTQKLERAPGFCENGAAPSGRPDRARRADKFRGPPTARSRPRR